MALDLKTLLAKAAALRRGSHGPRRGALLVGGVLATGLALLLAALLPSSAPASAPQVGGRDPFAPSARMRALLAAEEATPPAPPQAAEPKDEPIAAAPAPQVLPAVHLRGLVTAADRPAIALLEIEGSAQLWHVSSGSAVEARVDGRMLRVELVAVEDRGVRLKLDGREALALR